MRRLILLGLVVAVLTPGTWVRTPSPPANYESGLSIRQIEPSDAFQSDDLTLDAAWLLTSTNTHFGGYSGLVALDDSTLLAGSDKARLLELPLPLNASLAQMRFLKPPEGKNLELPRELVDLEAITFDSQTGTLWASYEHTQTIERHSPRGAITERDPPEMQGWEENGGPEVMQRQPDGRFLVIGERPDGWFASDMPGLLFERDPVEEQSPLAFRFPDLEGYSPVDATMLPDGRVMILLRDIQLQWPIRFRSALAIADPADIKEDELWEAEIVARLSGPGLDANFEGLASIPREDGGAELYVISDDNFSNLQETILLRLIWQPAK